MAARRTLRVLIVFFRSVCRCSRKAVRRRDREVFDRKVAGTDSEPLRREDHQQPEALGVALQGVGADAALVGQVDLQESREMRGEISHGFLHCHEPARWLRRCRATGAGVASRYQ